MNATNRHCICANVIYYSTNCWTEWTQISKKKNIRNAWNFKHFCTLSLLPWNYSEKLQHEIVSVFYSRIHLNAFETQLITHCHIESTQFFLLKNQGYLANAITNGQHFPRNEIIYRIVQCGNHNFNPHYASIECSWLFWKWTKWKWMHTFHSVRLCICGGQGYFYVFKIVLQFEHKVSL